MGEAVVGVGDGALAVGVGLEVGQGLDAAVDAGVAHLLEADGRDEAGRAPGLGDLAVQLVDLLEREALGLVDHEPHEGGAHEAEAAPDEEHLDAQVRVALLAVAAAHEVRRRVGDGPVEQPVGRGRHRERLGPHLEREDLARDDPGHRAPRAREEEDVEAHERDEHLVRHQRRRRHAHDRHDELAYAHADGAEQEQWSSTPLLDHVQAREGREHVDDVGDDRDREGVIDARVLEEFRAVIWEKEGMVSTGARAVVEVVHVALDSQGDQGTKGDSQKIKLTPLSC